jgi:predicted DCC family thiol-disulfide oxidoreductase YuxK
MNLHSMTVWYDASCPLCRAEIGVLADADADGVLRLVDCSAPGFDDPEARAAGIGREALMGALHARDGEGRWLVGVEAFEAIYRAVGIESVARLWGHPWLKPLLVRLYPWIARNRQALSRLGLTGLFEAWVRREARQAAQRRCAPGGACAVPDRTPRDAARSDAAARGPGN